ncbi:MAG: hypothetical protein KBD23_01980 [Gammaproteobacteria bacterium]|nr:hypothetical protein [Gammaproteobacteria bacterium]MBP9728893.1 hypothetical protein [Gammaproteobacteria bacterium]
MFIVPTQPQTAWQVVRSGFALWQSTFRFVGPFSIGFATINAGHDYYTLSVVDNHSLTPSVFMMGMLSVWIHASIIDAIHRGRGQPIYHYLAWPNSLKKSAMFLVVIILTLLMILAGTLCLIIPGIILSIYLAFAPYLAIIDDSGIVQSIRNSFAISDKYGWFLSNRLSMIALILFILVLGILLVVLGACFLFSDKSVMNVEEQIKIVTIPVLWFLNAFLYPLLHALMLETLYDLRLRKAGL